ncbi:MAG: SIMPL domain-containing protein [Alistipes sp.]|nr:SIMPL domain-containing protein [Alistipes sp.]MBQ3249380.1 SIMPL domain-containing protein [Alistipes sp.]MBR3826721.1 SIMPL domain-containing protein [Alistipes sp.]
MNNLWKYIIIATAIVLSAVVLATAYTQRYRTATGTITVTGLGETEFTSDLIIIKGHLHVEQYNVADGYRRMDSDRTKVVNFLKSHGIAEDNISFAMLTHHENYSSVYQEGKYIGETFDGYSLKQEFTIESKDIDAVESVARELTSLLADGINISVDEPMYFYSDLNTLKLDLIASAAADARERAELIASNSHAKLGDLTWSTAGVFQITAATGDEEFSAGGAFNLSSREKKARVTVRAEYKIKND